MTPASLNEQDLFDPGNLPPRRPLSPAEQRQQALTSTPETRAEFTRKISINVDGYRLATDFVENLIARSRRTNRPGGIWLMGDGGVGKSFVLDAIHDRHSPSESMAARSCPVLSLTFASRPAESDILLSLLLQLGQDPYTLSYQKNSELEAIFLDAVHPAGTLAILFDEAQHLWLNTTAYRVADRMGGRLGDFLKRLYDRSGLAFIYAGTTGLENLLAADSQARTRWSGSFRLTPFTYDNSFVGLLSALDAAIPMPDPAGLATPELANRIFEATQGNFRLLKTLLSEAVFLAASEGSNRITKAHLARAHFLTFCSVTNPFDTQ